MKNIVHLIDCMEFMRGLPDNAYDLAIVDPPYGIGRDGQREYSGNPGHNRKYYEYKGWDSSVPSPCYWKYIFRCSKNQIIFGANYFTKNLPSSMGWIFWDKGQRGLGNSDGELIFTSFDRALRAVVFNRKLIDIDGSIHPTQKPVDLYKWILKNYAKPGQTIFDSHVGSGSIRIACHDLGFDFEGCELDPDYHEAQEKRYQDHAAQSELFASDEIQTLTFGE